MPNAVLNKDVEVRSGAHILYIFQEESDYLDNLAAYVMGGINLNQFVLVIDHAHIYEKLRNTILDRLPEENLQRVLFRASDAFYGTYTEFQTDRIVSGFESLLSPLLQSNRTIRTWAKVVWRDDKNIVPTLDQFETMADDSVKGQRLISVCAYDESHTPNALVLKMLRTHDYLMTDTELVDSPLYAKKSTYPSLSVQSKTESEIDFYKSKLDFVHAVSHEVRNPLTVISGYAKILRSTEPTLSAAASEKLITIERYVSAIDQELTHIMETEQMLSNDLFMKLEPIHTYEVAAKVVTLMETKSMVQNVTLVADVNISAQNIITGNTTGLRLILSNLISNAIKYSREHGRVEFTSMVSQGRTWFIVKDNGIGMSERQLESMFEKYAKFSEGTNGQGIGLYIVKKLTDRFRGRVTVSSQLGVGTTVSVDFPSLGTD
ncbi:ATP-binding protein [Alicyclobacillus sp. ALC3]|uniref:ATP-binding protein n=1 Tax=Alicyclobacillus sp. ALC3 TaxID=2796143 RepID=UPI002377EC07|nr:ATP-binding protein [Alicyclobacillus sp. ALC3]WDL97882.1 MEDS domain-containing protein [Alicyclobacillus sp. ALC3]